MQLIWQQKMKSICTKISRELLTRLPALYWNLDSSIRLMLSLRDVTLNTTSRKINNEGVNN